MTLAGLPRDRTFHKAVAKPSKGRVLLLLTNVSPTGGAEVQSIQLALRLKERNWDVRVASLLPVRTPLTNLEEAGIRVESANMRKGLGAVNSAGALIKLIRSFRPLVLHCHMAQATLAGRLARCFANVPVVIGTLHGLMMYSVSGHHQRWLEHLHRLTDRLADTTTVVCQAGLAYYYTSNTVSAQRLRYVPNGVDTEAFRIDPSQRERIRAELKLGNEFVWLNVGRFDPIKDHKVALKGFASMLDRHPNSQMLLAGGGDLEPDLRALATALGIESRVRFLGRRQDVSSLMNAADAMILTSTYEALPLVLLEAAACGLPAVATRVGGTEEAILEGLTGYLAPVADTVAVADAMSRLAGTPSGERSRMARAAREHVVRHYHFDAVMDQWEGLYGYLLDRRRAWRGLAG